jgi:hypothetical protein
LNQSKQAPFHKKTVSPDGFFMFARAFTFATRMKAESQKLKAQGERQKAEAGRIVKVRNQPSEIRNSILWVAYLK